MIRLEKFTSANYADLISWIDSEESLMQFGGPLFKFPLTNEQLDTSLSDPQRVAFCIVSNETNKSIGHCEIYLSGESARIGRILIGDIAYRGKGLCPQIVNLLLDNVFFKFNKPVAELNVFDWNKGAIKCYEKVGFAINPNKVLERKVKDQTWLALNMTIDRHSYKQTSGTTH
jgi:RimJ/RimL family protein N-acetyltransferase